MGPGGPGTTVVDPDRPVALASGSADPDVDEVGQRDGVGAGVAVLLDVDAAAVDVDDQAADDLLQGAGAEG